jgi:flagellar motility protein MotE (MotC chaperone)
VGKQIAIYGGFFVLMLGAALAATGVLQEAVVPRILGVKAAPAGPEPRGEASPAKAEGGAAAAAKAQGPAGADPPPETSAAKGERAAQPGGPVEAPRAASRAAADPKRAEGADAAKADPARAREEQVKELEARIQQQREALATEEQRLVELKAAIAELGKRHEAAARERDAKDAEKVQRLARLYEAMKPKEAAIVLEKMDRGLALEILAAMKDGKASKILGAIQPGTAADLTKRLGPPLEERKAGGKERGRTSG